MAAPASRSVIHPDLWTQVLALCQLREDHVRQTCCFRDAMCWICSKTGWCGYAEDWPEPVAPSWPMNHWVEPDMVDCGSPGAAVHIWIGQAAGVKPPLESGPPTPCKSQDRGPPCKMQLDTGLPMSTILAKTLRQLPGKDSSTLAHSLHAPWLPEASHCTQGHQDLLSPL